MRKFVLMLRLCRCAAAIRLLSSTSAHQYISTSAQITLFLILVFLFTSCAEKKTVIWKGYRVNADIASRQSLTEIETLYRDKEYDRAKIECEKFLQTFPENSNTDDVYYYLGSISFEAKAYPHVINILNKFLNIYTKSNKWKEALILLGFAHERSGDTRGSTDVLLSVTSSKLTKDEMKLVYSALAANYKNLKNYRNALTWNIKEYKLYDTIEIPEDQDHKNFLKSEIIQIIDERLTVQDLRELLESSGKEFPTSYYYIKLIKYFYHTQDYELALALANKFLTKFSDGSYTQEIQGIVDELTKTAEVKPKKVGCLLPLTGKFASYGNDTLSGILLASGIFSNTDESTIEIAIRDTGDSESTTAKALMDLYSNEEVIAIIGPLTQETAAVAAIHAQNVNLPIITLSQKEYLTNIGDYVFRNFITKSNQVEKLVRFARFNMGIENFALLYPNHVHGKEFANLFWDSVIRNGGSVTSVESYDKDAKDFSRELKKLAGTFDTNARSDEICETTDRFSNKIKGINCFSPETLPPEIEFEALFIPDTYFTVSLIAPALSFYDITGVQLLGINSLNHPDFIPRSGEEHIQGILFTDIFLSESSKDEVVQFNNVYKNTFIKDPNLFSALGYDTMNIVKKILNEYKPSSRRVFKDSLRSIQNYHGVSGITSFSQSNDADKDLFLLSIDNGKIVEVK